jgi:hypothetical protein
MDNPEFKVRIIDFYRDIGEPAIITLCKDNECKELLELSTISDFSIIKKNKNKWKIKDKRKLLKEIDIVKKNKIKEITDTLSQYSTINKKTMAELENINNLKKTLEKDEIYNKLKNLSTISSKKCSLVTKNKTFKNIYKSNDNFPLGQIKIIDVKNSLSDDYIEIYSNFL